MNATIKRSLALALAALQALPVTAYAGITDITTLPMSALSSIATPNVIFGIDDSGSMDFELLMPTNDGALWYDTNNKAFWNAGGVYYFNTSGNSGGNWYKYAYLFPNGSTQEARQLTDATTDHFALPPLPAYAFARSAVHNPLYYNPATTYLPWAPAYIGGTTLTFGAAASAPARSHPYWPTSGTSAANLTLTSNQSSTSTNFTFRMIQGMVIPWTSVSGMQARKNGAGGWSTGPSPLADYTIPANEYWDVNIPYYPATYFVVDATCTSGASCATAPDGKKLRRYEIKSGNTFPSGRTYAAELQNFANWFTYYRKRKLQLASAAGAVLSQVKGLRGGSTYFNSSWTLSMYDFSSTVDSTNAKALLKAFYLNPSSGGTPTRDALNDIGQQFVTNRNVIQYSCQRNSAFIMTDGFANTGMSGSLPSYAQATWESARPFQSIFANSLADIASSYYTINVRPDLPTGLLNVDSTDTSPLADKNPNLHMNTYALTLGALGTIYGTGTPAATNPFLNYPTWPNPNANHSPTAVDDLWHATLNGRGKMFTTSDATSLIKSLRDAISAMLARSGSDASVAISNVNVHAGDNTVYVSNYNGTSWSGELAAYPIDVSTGQVTISPATQLWEARDQLNAVTPANRLIATYDGGTGVPFESASLSPAYNALLNTPSVTPVDNADVLAWLRGDRSKEATTYRSRAAVLGDIVDAAPVVVAGAMAKYVDTGYTGFATTIATRPRIVYQGANDGMMHAFDATNGSELWAYVPGLVAPRLNALTSAVYSHQYYVDGTPTVGDVNIGTWKTILVGGLRAGGNGYYALDITAPAAANETAVAAKVMWEFPNALTTAADRNNVGLSFGKPVIAKTRAAGWVVLVTSGYNNTAGDGRGYLFVLNPSNGAVLKAIPTTAGSPSSPSGLAQIAAFANDAQTDATIEAAYGGDLFGNLWRFDLSGPTINSWSVSKLATLVDATSAGQPITTAPELVETQGTRLVIVGTGALLGQTDVATTQGQSVYGIADDGTGSTIANVRTALKRKTVTVAAGGIRNITADVVDFTTYKGWYFDMPGVGERASSDATVIFGALVFATNQPSASACSGKSFLYAVDASNGGQLPSSGFLANETPWSGKQIANFLANQPVLALLPSGTVEALTHVDDGSLSAVRIPIGASNKVKPIAWKELLR